MEVGEYGLTHGICFVALRHEVVVVAGLLWITWCVFGGADFLCFIFSICFFFFERTRPAASMRPPCRVYRFTSTGVRTGYRYLISLSVCLCMCNIRRFY